MRTKYSRIARSSQGGIIPTCIVSVFLTGTTTPASIYTASSGGVAVNSVTSTVTGYFEFWIDSNDYAVEQWFDVVLSKTSYDPQTYTKALGIVGTSTTLSTANGSTYAVPVGAVTVINSYSSGGTTFTLPTATLGKTITIVNRVSQTVASASSNVYPIAGGSLSSSLLAATAGKWCIIVGDGTNWYIVAAN
jgi:hypothetical protein